MSEFKISICVLVIAFVLPGLLNAGDVYASECDNVDSNQEWTVGFELVRDAFEKEDWDNALNLAKKLLKICESSPALNYTIAQIFRKKNDKEKYLFYLQKATEMTERFAVDRNFLDKMWSEKYIAAHPDADPEIIAKRQMRIETLKSRVELMRTQQAAVQAELDATRQELEMIKSNQMQNGGTKIYKSLLWTGVGIGLGGIALISAGAAMSLTMETPWKEEKIKINGMNGTSTKTNIKEQPLYMTGLGFVGAGAAMLATGVVLTGIYGYKYTHAENERKLSFYISPLNTGLQIYF